MEETEPEILYPGARWTRGGSGSPSNNERQGMPPVAANTDEPSRKRIDFSRLTFSAMRQNPVYALFIITFLYWIYRLLVTILYPVVRPPIVDFFTAIYHGMGSPLNSPFFSFAYTTLDLIHRLFEKVIYPIVCVHILDRLFVVVLVVILCMFLVWLLWKYVLVWPIKDIFGAILQNTPPMSWAWDFFEDLERVIFGDNTTRLEALAKFVASGFGIVSDEGQSRLEGSGPGKAGGPDPVAPTPAGEIADVAVLSATVSGCASRYTPYDFTDPFSQIMVRTELTKCKLKGIETYMGKAEPTVAERMRACDAQSAMYATPIPQAEFVPTTRLVAALEAPGNVSTVDSTGMKTVKHGATVVARQVDDKGVIAVLDASGNAIGYVNASKTRVMPGENGGFVAVSSNLQQALDVLSRADMAFNPHVAAVDPMGALLRGSDTYVQCQLSALATSSVNVHAELNACANDEGGVADPELRWTDISGSVGNTKQFASDSAARQKRVGACQNKKGTEFAKLT